MHGISAASGTRFEEPVEVRRMTGKVDGKEEGKGIGQSDGWEGLCGTCGIWMTLGGGVPWFRHAYKVRTRSWKRARRIADVYSVIRITSCRIRLKGSGRARARGVRKQ